MQRNYVSIDFTLLEADKAATSDGSAASATWASLGEFLCSSIR